MALSRTLQTRLKIWALTSALAGLAGTGYAYVTATTGLYDWVAWRGWLGFCTGLAIGATTGAFEFLWMPSRQGRRLRRHRLIHVLAVRTLVHLTLIVAGIASVRLLFYLQFPEDKAVLLSEIWRIPLFALIVILVFLFIVQMRSLIGARTLANLLLGRYHRARKEERIFLFLDVEGSTSVAAELGDVRFHAFLAKFFHEADEIVSNHGGEILSYVGDAMIVTWPMGNPEENARVIAALGEIAAYTREAAADYEAEFGIAAGFRAAVHGGPVVAGEYGSSKRQITYLGDVVNATARLENLGKSLKVRIAVSQQLVDRMRLPDGAASKPLGEHPLKGIKAPMGVCEIAFPSPGAP
ncbi:MAG: adenylate/guanylate cyclase domain-containing protein [Methyloligellaceae bacterium]